MKIKKPVYQDKPRFNLSYEYENQMKRMYSSGLVNMIKMIGIKMNSMIKPVENL